LVTFLQTASDATNLQTYTFSSQNLGAANSKRYIIVAIASRNTRLGTTINSVRIGGVTATISVQSNHDDSPNSSVAGLAVANVPTGTTGDIVVTFSTTMLRAYWCLLY